MAKFRRASNSITGTAYIAIETIGDHVRQVKIEGREVFETENDEEIDALRRDPEIEELAEKKKK